MEKYHKKGQVNGANIDGSSDVLTRYFNTNASAGSFPSQLAFFLSFTLAIFGLTFVASRIAFSWFGVIMMIGALGLAAFGVQTWYLLMLEGMELIMLVFIMIVMTKRNYATVA